MTATQSLAVQLADALRQQAVQAGAATPAVRGADWRLAVVQTVNADGTILTTDGITARRMETYVGAAATDLIVITQSGNGNWLAWGRGSTGAFAVGETKDVRKPSLTGRTNNTLLADPHLTVDVVPGEYRVDATIFYDADNAADLKLGWISPASTTGAWWPCGSEVSNTTQAATARWGAVTDFGTGTLPVAGIGSGTVVTCRPVGTAVVTGTGQIALAWAQQVNNATATQVRGNSTLSVKRIA